MAKFQKKKIEETQGSGFGQYKEGVGGGSSPKPGEKREYGKPGVNSEHRKNNNDTMQARTSDGKFTYKSVNGESIDPKYGPSRGKTVNPLLTGGKNGVKISDVEQEFSAESGSYWNKFKDKWYTKGGEMALSDEKGKKWTVRVAGEAIWEIAKRRYDKVKGEFESESKTFEEVRKGRLGKEEQAAKQQAQKSGSEQAVLDQASGGIKLKPGMSKQIQSAPVPPSVGSVPPSPVAPAPGISAPSQLKHTSAQLSAAKKLLSDAGLDVSGYTDEQLDQIVDDYIDFGEEDKSTDGASNSADKADKEPSESEKKMKEMGFGE